MKKVLKYIQDELDLLLSLMATNNLLYVIHSHILELEIKIKHLLDFKEATWHLKSREIWIKEGDKNIKFFHCYSNQRHNTNTIWGLNDAEGNHIRPQDDISNATTTHFKVAYEPSENIFVEDLIWGIELYLTMFDQASNDALFRCITEEELLNVLKYFNYDKSSGPDGWNVWLFTHFFLSSNMNFCKRWRNLSSLGLFIIT